MSFACRLAVALAVGLCMGAPAAPGRGADPAPPTTQQVKVDDQMAYAIGIAVGRHVLERMKEDGIEADTAQVVKGLSDALAGKPPPYDEEELEALVLKVEQAVATRLAEQFMATNPSFRKMAEENAKASRDALVGFSRLDGVETLKTGVLVKIIKEGAGPYIANATTVTANFTIALADLTMIQATEPGKPLKVPTSRVLPILRDTMHGMRVGTVCRIAVPPEQAFGLAGKPPVIGPNQALLFDIEVIAAEWTTPR